MRTQQEIQTLRDYFNYTGRRIYQDYQDDSRRMGIWFHRFLNIENTVGDKPWTLEHEQIIERFVWEYNEWVEDFNSQKFKKRLNELAQRAMLRNQALGI
jgi:hypothetical protein